MATLSLHSLFELRSCILNGTVMLDMRVNSIEEIAGMSLVQILMLYLQYAWEKAILIEPNFV